MVSGACLNTYKATYTSAERTLSSESGHSSCFKKNWGGGGAGGSNFIAQGCRDA